MRKLYILALAVILLSGNAFAQEEVSIGQYRFTPPGNVSQLKNRKAGFDESTKAEGRNFVLVQFKDLPTTKQRKTLSKKGIILNDYLGGNAYFSSFSEGNLANKLENSNIYSVIPVKPEWKINSRISTGDIPKYADAGNGSIRVILRFNPSVDPYFVKETLTNNNVKIQNVSSKFSRVDMTASLPEIKQIAKYPWVVSISLTQAPMELYNSNGRSLSGVNTLSASAELNGRGLTGKGVNVGVWDGNVERHVDLGERLHTQEAEAPSEHGMHVSGTVAGAGILDPLAKGMAPEANLYTYNFTKESNGLNGSEEMNIARERFNISITQNSYGLPVSKVCQHYDKLSYNATGVDFDIDLLANNYPTLTHVFAAGNDQGACDKEYGHTSRRSKNIIYVGAVDKNTKMSDFSSWGPLDDGRLMPTISTMGVDVYSTVYDNKYDGMSGTSMACPTASGTIALITERYMQLNKGKQPLSALIRAIISNTAEDRGNPEPDYKFGYGILNGEKAVQTIENNWYAIDNFTSGDNTPKTYTIDVPANMNANRLRVMVVWNDTVADKEYAYGEKALINDIDLSVNGTLPWILDGANPSAPAIRGVDELNNIEQVTIDNPTGAITVTVTPKTITSSKQQYVLVWWFDTSDLRLSYPNGGDLIAPGEELIIRWDNATKPVNLEISYDAGKTYTLINSNLEADQYAFKVPEETAATDKALIRISDDTNVDVSDAPFVVIGVPQNLTIEKPECGNTAWKLKWDVLAGITKYEILKANVAEGTFEILGEATNNAYDIPEDKISLDARNVFTVRAKTDAGAVGRRAKGILVNSSQTLALNPTKLPFVERFNEYPSRYISTDLDQGMKINYVTNELSSPDHIMVINPTAANSTWSNDDPYKTGNKRATLRMCNLDLTAADANTQLILSLKVSLKSSEDVSNSQFRTLINDNVVPDMSGNTSIIPITKDGFRQTAAYDLTSYIGQNINFKLEYIGKSQKDTLKIEEIKVFEANDDIDLIAQKIHTPELESGKGENSPINCLIQNNSPVTVENIPVGYSVNGQAFVYETIKELKPYQLLNYNFVKKADLSTQNPTGEIFTLNGIVNYNNDSNADNDTAEITVDNFGDVFKMGLTYTVKRLFFGEDIIISKITKKVDESLIFTDNGGGLYGYPDKQSHSFVRFVPSDPNKVIQISFKNVNLEDGYDSLLIYTSNISAEFPGKWDKPSASITGSKQNLTFISRASDGAIVVDLNSDKYTHEEGWVAEVREILKTNTYTLTVEPFQNFHEDGNVPVKINVENHAPISMKNVKVAYRIDKGEWIEEVIPQIEADNSAQYTFKKLLEANEIRYYYLDVRIVSDDADQTDNYVSSKVVNDKYCHNTTIEDELALWITNVKVFEKERKSGAGNKNVDYQTETEFDLYKQSETKLTVSTNANTSTDKAVGVWIDWNNDGVFNQTDEQFTVNLQDNQTEYEIPIAIPSSAQAGKLRMRIIASDSDKVKACNNAKIALGDIEDYTINLKDESYPVQNDLELSDISVKTGKNLTAAEDIKVTIKNHSALAISSFNIAYKVNNANEVIENKTIAIPAFDSIEYTFDQKLDMSSINVYNISAYLSNNDENLNNDTIARVVANVIPETDGFYALNMNGDENEHIDLGKLNKANLDKAATYEAWINLNPKNQIKECNTIFVGKGLGISVKNNTESPTHELTLEVAFTGQTKVWTSALKNVIEPGKWHHLAVSSEFVSGNGITATSIIVFIDGEKITMDTDWSFQYLSGNNEKALTLAPGFDGMIDEVRIWDNIRTKYQIKAGMFKHFKEADGSLPDHLLIEYSFDEGPDNLGSISGNSDFAKIHSERLNAAADCIWKAPKQLITGSLFNQQTTLAEKVSDNTFNLKLEQGTDLSAITGGILTSFPNTKLKYSAGEASSTNFDNFIQTAPTAFDTMTGIEVDETTIFDFTTNQTISVAAQTEIFGKTLNQLVFFKSEYDVSSECDLSTLSVKQTLNPGLANDANAEVSQSINIDLTGITDITKVKLSFTTSPNAKLMYKGVEVVNEDTEIDLSKPALVTVIAENGRDSKTYCITVVNPQTITWNLTSTQYTYGDNPATLNGTATSTMPINYVSTDNNVATVLNGKLIISGYGTAHIIATQKGGEYWAKATPVSHQVTVARKAITATPVETTIGFAENVPTPEFNYEGLVNDEDAKIIENPAYKVYKNGTDLWDITQGYLPVGNHTWKPVEATYNTGNYVITNNEGSLKVEQGNAYDITFVVTDGSSAVQNAKVDINNFTFTTDADGKAVVTLIHGNYQYIVNKENYTTLTDSLKVKDADKEVVVEINLQDISLNYLSDANGTIVGNPAQKIVSGSDGEEVSASPMSGYKFVKWSDDITDNPRTDKSVTENITVTATFEKIMINVNYIAENGGTIQGIKEQSIKYGENGTEVTAIAEPEFEFIQWSDGNINATRKDVNAKENAEYIALFKYKNNALFLPYTQNFDKDNQTPADWQNIDSLGGKKWVFQSESVSDKTVGEHNFAYLQSKSGWFGTTNDAKLLSPWFNITNLDSDIAINFDYLLNAKLSESFLSVKYRISEDSPWQEIKKITKADPSHNTVSQFSDTIAKADLTAKTKIQFAFHGYLKKGYTILLDNINISADYDKITLIYLASQGGSVNGEISVKEEIAPGETGTSVTATPNNGYYFEKWSDGNTENSRTDDSSTIVTAIFKKGSAPSTGLYTLAYKAGEGGSIEGLAWQPDVLSGTDGLPVTAVADSCYVFSKWSDGVLNNPRNDKNVTNNTNVTAEFIKSISTYAVNFVVTNQDNESLQGVTITIDGKTLATDAEGKATIKLANGSYDYSLSLDDYTTETGSLTVSDAEQTVEIQLATTGIKDLFASKINVYPNPTVDAFWLDADKSFINTKVEIYSSQGSLVKTEMISGKTRIDLSDLGQGAYFVRIKNQTFKIIKR